MLASSAGLNSQDGMLGAVCSQEGVYWKPGLGTPPGMPPTNGGFPPKTPNGGAVPDPGVIPTGSHGLPPVLATGGTPKVPQGGREPLAGTPPTGSQGLAFPLGGFPPTGNHGEPEFWAAKGKPGTPYTAPPGPGTVPTGKREMCE